MARRAPDSPSRAATVHRGAMYIESPLRRLDSILFLADGDSLCTLLQEHA